MEAGLRIDPSLAASLHLYMEIYFTFITWRGVCVAPTAAF